MHSLAFTRHFTSGPLAGLTHDDLISFPCRQRAAVWLRGIRRASRSNSINYRVQPVKVRAEVLLASRSWSNESQGKGWMGCIARDGVILAGILPDGQLAPGWQMGCSLRDKAAVWNTWNQWADSLPAEQLAAA